MTTRINPYFDQLTPILESSDDDMHPIIDSSDGESEKSVEEIPSLMEIPSNLAESRSPGTSDDSNSKKDDFDNISNNSMEEKRATKKAQRRASSKKPGKSRKKRETVAVVFNDNIEEGEVMAKNLSKSGCNVVAILKSFNTIAASSLMKIPRVTVLVLDSTDPKKIAPVIEGANRAILMTENWESFESDKEERKAISLILACHQLKMPQMILSTIENKKTLKKRGLQSQIQQDKPPKFEGMKKARRVAKKTKVQLLHMITAYRDYNKSDDSMCLLSAGKGAPFVVRSDAPPKSKSKKIPGEIKLATPEAVESTSDAVETPPAATDALVIDKDTKGSSVQTTTMVVLLLSFLCSYWVISNGDIRTAIEERLPEMDLSSLQIIRYAIEDKIADIGLPSVPPFMNDTL